VLVPHARNTHKKATMAPRKGLPKTGEAAKSQGCNVLTSYFKRARPGRPKKGAMQQTTPFKLSQRSATRRRSEGLFRKLQSQLEVWLVWLLRLQLLMPQCNKLQHAAGLQLCVACAIHRYKVEHVLLTRCVDNAIHRVKV
jgi:hypothetical protein